MRATSGVFKGLNPTVTVASKILVISFVLFCVLQARNKQVKPLKWFLAFYFKMLNGFTLVY